MKFLSLILTEPFNFGIVSSIEKSPEEGVDVIVSRIVGGGSILDWLVGCGMIVDCVVSKVSLVSSRNDSDLFLDK
jgi:hypothetical protein